MSHFSDLLPPNIEEARHKPSAPARFRVGQRVWLKDASPRITGAGRVMVVSMTTDAEYQYQVSMPAGLRWYDEEELAG